MPLYFSDESKAPRACWSCSGRGWHKGASISYAFDHLKCVTCNGSGRINAGAQPDLEVRWEPEFGMRSYAWTRLDVEDTEWHGGFDHPTDALAAARAALKGGN